MSTPSATLDGFPLDASSPIGWTYQAGVEPHRRVFSCHRGVAEAILAQAQPGSSVLEFDVPGFGRERVEKLTLLRVGAAADPNLATVEVADMRYLLAQRRVYGRYNVRRRTGERRRVQRQGVPVAVNRPVDDVAFAPWSIDGERRWEPGNMIRRVLDRLLRDGERYEIRPLSLHSFPVEGLLIDDPGDGCLRRLAGYFGGLIDYYVDAGGTLVVYDKADGSERALVGLDVSGRGSRVRGAPAAGPPSVVGPPLWSLVDRSIERPVEFFVYFSRLAELRFDGQDENDAGADRGERGDIPLHMEMVLDVPDVELAIPELDGRPARTVLEGTWITFREALAAWNAAGWPLGCELTLLEIRKRFLVPDGLYSLYAPAHLDEEGIYARRLAAVLRCFRQTYRIVREWRDRLGELFAQRVELRDSENGTWAASEVYGDYAITLTRRGQEKALAANPKNAAVVVNRYAAGQVQASVHGNTITSLRPAPAAVQIVDQDQGIVRLNYLLEPRLGERAIVPSAVQADTIPSMDPTAPVYEQNMALARLSARHEVSVVLSTMPVAPNDTRALHVEKVTPEEVEAFLGLKVGTCRGPRAEIRAHPANRRGCSRHAWDDWRAAEIRLAFKFVDQDRGDPTLAFGDPLNPDELRAIALAACARHLIQRRDQVEGSLTTAWWPGVRPTGAAASVSYTVMQGEALTTIDFPRLQLAEDSFAFLPEHVRQVVLGEVIP